MQFVKITVDGVTYHLVKQVDGTWIVTNRAPLSAGEYVMSVTMVTETGQEVKLDTTDENLLKAVTLLVQDGTTDSGNRMLNYYPEVIKVLREFQALTCVEGFEVDFLKSDIDIIVNDAWLSTMGEGRIKEWEKLLKLTPKSDDTLVDRRDRIIATMRGRGKLNTALISSVVNAYTGGVATSFIENSVLYVRIEPPENNKQFKFTNVENTLRPLVPAQLGLSVTRNYATWGDIKNNFASWQAVSELDNWEALKLYVAP